MHPIERLRYVARSQGGDQRALVRETAGALRGLGLDPAGLVVACRRIVERHPSSGPLWWLCSSILAAGEPFAVARALADEIEDDPTPDVLVEVLPDGATVCVLGWPDLAGEALLRRGDVAVLAVDVADEGATFVRRLQRADVDAEVVDPGGLAAAVLASDIVLVEALAAGDAEILAVPGSRAVASVGYCSDVPVWMVVGRGRCLPEITFTNMLQRVADVRVPWQATCEPVPFGLATAAVRPGGVFEPAEADLRPECPVAHELLRSSPM